MCNIYFILPKDLQNNIFNNIFYRDFKHPIVKTLKKIIDEFNLYDDEVYSEESFVIYFFNQLDFHKQNYKINQLKRLGIGIIFLND